MRARDPLEGRHAGFRELGEVAFEVIVRQREDGELFEPAGDAAETLHAVGKDAAQIAHALVELLGGDRLVAQPRELTEDLGRGARRRRRCALRSRP